MWFTENPWPPMLIAAVCALVCFGLWNRDRRNLFFLLTMAFLLMTGGIYAVERVIVTESERLQSDVTLLCEQFRKRDIKALDHFSDSVPQFKQLCETVMKEVEIRDDMRLSNFHTTFTNRQSRALVHFRANCTISAWGYTGFHPFRCVLTYQREGSAWKITDVQRLDPINGEKISIKEAR